MAECWNTDTGDAVYRSRDAVKNLRIKVRIQRVTSTAAISQHLQQQVLAQKGREGIDQVEVLAMFVPLVTKASDRCSKRHSIVLFGIRTQILNISRRAGRYRKKVC
uniref:Uncharacterized protein n=1 Tax=Fundulus heteroclitus TaxID=8078 RepID=A0A3Q2Q051_FUNHE